MNCDDPPVNDGSASNPFSKYLYYYYERYDDEYYKVKIRFLCTPSGQNNGS